MLSLKRAMITAPVHTVNTDTVGYTMMIQLQKSWVITHSWPQEPPTAPKAVSAAR